VSVITIIDFDHAMVADAPVKTMMFPLDGKALPQRGGPASVLSYILDQLAPGSAAP
jgi:hypothetical protein